MSFLFFLRLGNIKFRSYTNCGHHKLESFNSNSGKNRIELNNFNFSWPRQLLKLIGNLDTLNTAHAACVSEGLVKVELVILSTEVADQIEKAFKN